MLQNPAIRAMILSKLSAAGQSPENIQALLMNPAVQAMILAKIQQGQGQALLQNPQVQAMVLNNIAAEAPTLPPIVIRATTARTTTTARPTTTKKPASAIPPGLDGIPGFAELAANFPGGPAKLQEILNDPQVLNFIQNNPDIVQSVIGTGPPDPQRLEALLALAAPPPPGVKQGIFGPDIFADEEFDVQGFGDYEYDDYEDYEDYEEDKEDDEYADYGNFEGDNNGLEQDQAERQGRSQTIEKTTTVMADLREPKVNQFTQRPNTEISKPIIKYRYRLLNSRPQK